MYTRDIVKTRFRAPEGALEAPNHALAPQNEVLRDSKCFNRFPMVKNLGNKQKFAQIGQYISTQDIAKIIFGHPGGH